MKLTFYDICPGVTAFSSTRHGGVSRGQYAEFNINHYCGDDENNVAVNRQVLCEQLGIALAQLVYPHQTHGTTVRQIGREFISLPDNIRDMILDGVDAVTTDVPQVCIGVSTADCIPILLADSDHHAVAAIHAGWRGTVARIVRATIESMMKSFGTQPENLKAVIGPGISEKNFEVGDEVYKAFAEAGFDMNEIAKRYPVMNRNSGNEDKEHPMRWHIDLWECNKRQLLECGLQDGNITVSGICTYDNVEDYFSARRLGTASGRIFTAIMCD